MALDWERDELTLGIVGTGIMGRGIAQVAAEAGIRVLLADARREAVDEAVAFVARMLRRKAEKGQCTPDEADRAVARVRATGAGPTAGYGDFAPCHVVIEAVAERLDVKHAVLEALEPAVSADCIIATNTSSLSVTSFAAKAVRPERVAGFHFFNPVPLMRLVEVVPGVLTDERVVASLIALARRLGHDPVRTTDTPGFLVNHAGRAYGTEALRIVTEGVADPVEVDRVMTGAAGFRMGPFELLDLTGLDVSHPVMESIYHQYYQEPRYRPAYLAAQRHAAGLFGRKVGRGFYHYEDGKAIRPEEPPAPALDPVRPVWISGRDADTATHLRGIVASAGARLETGDRPSLDALCLVTPWGEDATTAALAEDLDPERVVAVDMLFGLSGRRTAMTTPVTRRDMRDQAHAVLAADGSPVTVIRDSAGFVVQRIVACIVNVGSDIAQQRIAAPGDIDRAVELGLGYPRGPLRLGDTLGPRRILSILDNILGFTGDPRYRASPWLKRRARLGVPLTTPEP